MKLKGYALAAILLSQQVLATLAPSSAPILQQESVKGFVVPSQVGANEPFTFAASGVVEGEVITIQTVDGEVVERKKPDKLGRVFLPAGLAAGAYLLTRSGGGGKPMQITVPPTNQIPTGQAMNVLTQPTNLNIREGLSLQGQGFSADATQMAISCGNNQLPIMAATASELKTGPVPNLPTGRSPLAVTNTKTGETQKLGDVVSYDCQAQLVRTKLGNGERTALEFTFSPSNMVATVHARILSGPVHFEGGKNEAQVVIENGRAHVPLIANPAGFGRFSIAYEFMGCVPPGNAGNVGGGACDATTHKLVETGIWKKGFVTITDTKTGKPKRQAYAYRVKECWLHACNLPKNHGGDHNFKPRSKCTKVDTFTDQNGNGKWDENDGKWTDKNKNGKKDPGEYDDKDKDGKYDPPEPMDNNDKDPAYHGDEYRVEYFETEDLTDDFIKTENKRISG